MTHNRQQNVEEGKHCANLWSAVELKKVFQEISPKIERVARALSPQLVDVSMAIDSQSCLPLIRFVFAEKTAHDMDIIPDKISGYLTSVEYTR